MGWGTDVKIEGGSLYLSREVYSSKQELEYKINETCKEIESIKTRLKMMVIGDVNKLIDSDSDPIYWVSDTIDDYIDMLQECYEGNFIRRELLDNWELNNKK